MTLIEVTDERALQALSEKLARARALMPRDKDKAYLLGAIMGDGSANYYYYGKGKQHYLIQFSSSQREFVDSVMNAMRVLGIKPRITAIRLTGLNKKPQICIQGNNKPFVTWFLSLNPHKLETWLLENKYRMIAFVKGFYEAEGNLQRNRIRIYNSDKQLLKVVKKVLEYLKFHPTLIGGKRKDRPLNKSEYSINLNRIAERNRFLKIVQPCIKGGV